jgi:hypothetical protein
VKHYLDIRGWLALAPLLLAGCVRMEQILTLNPDGTGTLALTYSMAAAQVAQMEAMLQSTAEPGEAPRPGGGSVFSFNERDLRNDFKAYESAGVFLESAQVVESNGWKQVNLKARFQSLAGLARTDLVQADGLSLVRNSSGQYVLRQKAPPAGPAAGGEGAGIDPAAAAGMLAAAMKGFRAVVRIRVPGEIADTTADARVGREAAWTFDLEREPGALKRMQTADMRVSFSGAGLSLEEFPARPAAPPGR